MSGTKNLGQTKKKKRISVPEGFVCLQKSLTR